LNPHAPLVGILGGTFDPVHNAHLAVAAAATRALGLARLLWLPTGAPAYRPAPVASGAHRVAMLRLAIAAEPRYAIDERELDPAASGYTVDTLLALRRELQAAALVLVIGADQYAKRASWHRWDALAKLCRIAVIERPGAPEPLSPPAGDILHVPMTPQAVSASDIRARLRRGEDVSTLLPAPVLAYIRAHGLYR
jgi:nicotinate-nucleotide adenylyltransferase